MVEKQITARIFQIQRFSLGGKCDHWFIYKLQLYKVCEIAGGFLWAVEVVISDWEQNLT